MKRNVKKVKMPLGNYTRDTKNTKTKPIVIFRGKYEDATQVVTSKNRWKITDKDKKIRAYMQA